MASSDTEPHDKTIIAAYNIFFGEYRVQLEVVNNLC